MEWLRRISSFIDYRYLVYFQLSGPIGMDGESSGIPSNEQRFTPG